MPTSFIVCITTFCFSMSFTFRVKMILQACIIFGYFSAVNTQSTQPSLNQFCFGDVCYIRPDASFGRNWSEAQKRCKSFSSTLPIVDTPEHQRSFEAAVRNFTTGDERNIGIWIGAKAFNSQPANWTWLDGGKYNGIDLQSEGDYSKSYAYVEKTPTGVIACASPPNTGHSYICYYPTPADACKNDTGQTAFFIGNLCYVKYDKVLSWFSARNSCLADGGDLASFSNISLLEGKIGTNTVWVGLRNSKWNWQNAVTGLSSDVTYTLWKSGQPDDAVPSCITTVAFDGFPSWRDWDCSHPLPFVCQVIGNTWSTTTSSTTRRMSIRGSTSTSASTVSNGVAMETSSHFLTQGTSDTSRRTSLAMAIGIALGIGVPVIAIIIIVIIVIIIRRRKNARETEEQNVRDHSLPQDSLTPPTYMQLNMADRLEKNVYATIENSHD